MMSNRSREVRDRLERLEGKLSRAVLRGLGGSDAPPATRLLIKYAYRCAYCGKTNVPFEIDHIQPRSRGGSKRVSNLALACHECNQAKGSETASEFGHPEVEARAKAPLKDAAVNATRYKLVKALRVFGLPIGIWTGTTLPYELYEAWVPL
jgi:5-methylcytosine-specific restriction endonuclease McrA